MSNTRFVLTASLILLVFISPFCGFVTLKYNGLYDLLNNDGADEGETAAGCKSVFQFGNFNRELQSEGCSVFFCNADKDCALIASTSSGEESVEYGETPAALTTAKEIYQSIVDAGSQVGDDAQENEDSAETNEASKSATDDLSAIEKYAAYLSDKNYGYAFWQWASIFSVAISFCAMGFITSILTRNGRRFIDSDNRNITILALFSIVTGFIVVTLFAGGFLQGTLFPNFSGDILDFGFNSWSALKFRGQDWFKLALWAYIAGFYERFLPGILNDLMKKQKEEPDTDAGVKAK